MIDWMIEVLTNFKCDDQSFFTAVSLMDRYFRRCANIKTINDLHLIGITSMFLASKFEDIQPLRMLTIFEKIAHKKVSIDSIKTLELEMVDCIKYKL